MGSWWTSAQIRKQLARALVVALVVLAGDPHVSATGDVSSRPREPAARTRWRAPESSALTRNPVPVTQRSLADGKRIFQMRCADCHGEDGHGDGKVAHELSVMPAVLSDPQVQEQSDGALWFKITFGKRPMPAFGFRL